MTKDAFGYDGAQPLNKTSILNFGKYEGDSIGEVMKFDASYLLWAIEKKIFDVEPWLYDEIEELADEQDSDYHSAEW